ncbi:MAG: ABC transporter substrate-binding protein [Marvinbryantia sp.]|uniref:ABC transporter substrate-binding protein n=1 Tax=Marvinbryantia sp. TaxID=2496532 RepID=UPI0025DF3F9F|nr:ABC transporter substrate-binding protein [uncultured Marvinbryantia sp.]
MKKRFAALTMAAAMAMSMAGMAGAADEGALTPVSFRLNYTAAGLHVPFYYALEKGYYEEVGLDVTIGEGTGSGTTAKLVGTGEDDLGLVDSASVASAVAQDIPIKIVCPVYAVNGFAAITLADSGIAVPKDLEDKKVGITTGDAPSNLFAALEAANEIDDSKISYVTMDSNAKVTSLINGDVDAILGGADDQAITLQNMGKEVNVIRYSDNGAATVGLSIVASDSMIEENGETVEKFISASMKAWNECREDSAEAVEIFMQKFPTLDQAVVEGSLSVALDSLFAEDSETLGDVSEEDWNACRDLLVNYLGVDESIQAEDIYTYACLPEDLPAR